MATYDQQKCEKKMLRNKERHSEDITEADETLESYAHRKANLGEYEDARMNLPICFAYRIKLCIYLGNNNKMMIRNHIIDVLVPLCDPKLENNVSIKSCILLNMIGIASAVGNAQEGTRLTIAPLRAVSLIQSQTGASESHNAIAQISQSNQVEPACFLSCGGLDWLRTNITNETSQSAKKKAKEVAETLLDKIQTQTSPENEADKDRQGFQNNQKRTEEILQRLDQQKNSLADELIDLKRTNRQISEELKQAIKTSKTSTIAQERSQASLQTLEVELKTAQRECAKLGEQNKIMNREHSVMQKKIESMESSLEHKLVQSTEFSRVLLTTAKYLDPTNSLKKASFQLLDFAVPSLSDEVRTELARSGVFNDLLGILTSVHMRREAERACNICSELIRRNETAVDQAIKAGIVETLILMLDRPLDQINHTHLEMAVLFTAYATPEQGDILVTSGILDTLLRILHHIDNNVAELAITAIGNLIFCGAMLNETDQEHPYFRAMQISGGLIQIWETFVASATVETQTRAAVCLSRLYRAQPLPPQYDAIVTVTKKMSRQKSSEECKNGLSALRLLAYSQENHEMILKNDYLEHLAKNLSRSNEDVVSSTLFLLATLGMKGTTQTGVLIGQNVSIETVRRFTSSKNPAVVQNARSLMAILE
ncbi:MAG: hypothetical protein EZS28_002546 [Streblomastix strix]|uniref:Uncharacterized protein n=1 Tax=Streblomastix strix TaxID=222440 RepID=A0A5J4X3S2_9EUKA|nr:MAG: hypothetical protein EZS28_002546 [Streblomastix strix]